MKSCCHRLIPPPAEQACGSPVPRPRASSCFGWRKLCQTNVCLRQLEVELTVAYLNAENVLKYPIYFFNWLQHTLGARPYLAHHPSSQPTNRGLMEEVVTRILPRHENSWFFAFPEKNSRAVLDRNPAGNADFIHHISILVLEPFDVLFPSCRVKIPGLL